MEKEYLYNSSHIPSNIKINNEFIFGKEKIIILVLVLLQIMKKRTPLQKN